MPKYFFNIRSPDFYQPDQLGLDYPDFESMRTGAMKGARNLLAADLRAGRPLDHQQFEVTDEMGGIVFTLLFRDAFEVPSSPEQPG